ncbi:MULTISPECIES: hypothetical protein [Bacteria]|uniref:Uncharacterized protein n=2 Tax=Bacteria TaxID=2 RepID=A0A1I4UJ45_9BURK|nr:MULTISPECIES: hypothetical protein [Bacteria]SFE69198.1 hypothetical protein SAMN05216506_113168 [Saccharopolyspora kobensis]SFM88978.1 hypothetical protein SAMN02982985_05679 [Rugamonas rubra]
MTGPQHSDPTTGGDSEYAAAVRRLTSDAPLTRDEREALLGLLRALDKHLREFLAPVAVIATHHRALRQLAQHQEPTP